MNSTGIGILPLLILLSAAGCKDKTTSVNDTIETDGLVKGFVKTAATELPIDGAQTSTVPATVAQTTDAQGRFMFRIEQTGSYQLHASKHPFNASSAGIDVRANIATPAVTLLLRLAHPQYLEIVLTDVADTSLRVTARAYDPDGMGPVPATSQPLRIDAGRVYTGSVSVWRGGIRDSLMDAELDRSRDAYRFTYSIENFPAGRVVVANLNRDNRAAEFGSTFTITTTAGSGVNGTLRVGLRFHPSLTKGGLNYEDDFLVPFPLMLIGSN
ncbi:MAG: hypothetical protein KF749_07775 [Bacteroidetes bacterium]|nr:hypothetical protein [Bacteroidota bacterium]MCW5894957.1 hypothetical protein [Bacteroidota bacterium]